MLFLMAGCANIAAPSATQNAASSEPVATQTPAQPSEELLTESSAQAKDVVFEMSEISDEVFEKMQGKSYTSECHVPREDLRYLQMSYVDFDGNTQLGEMVVNKQIAQDVLEVFSQLYEAKYPIEKMRLIDEYDAVDEVAMTDNNSSAFCFRFINNTNKFSNHAKGMALDINPLYNPYVNRDKNYFEPKAAEPYLDRTKDVPYYMDGNDLAVKLFKERGFVWGGDYAGNTKDYQHIEMKNDLYADLMGSV